MRIIYYTPMVLDLNSAIGSSVRPVRMLEAFKKIGCDVKIVSGYVHDRNNSMKEVISDINNGIKYDFCYCEGPTMPTLLSERHRLPLHPFLDFSFLGFLKSQHIPIGLFYRDIHWIASKGTNNWNIFKEKFAEFFYKFDLKKYEKIVDIIYLPSLQMGEYIPIISKSKFIALPPGGEINFQSNFNNTLNIFYVGGVGYNYRIQNLFKGFNSSSAKLTICTREDEWNENLSHYKDLLSNNIAVVHKKGKELDYFYQSCNVVSLFVEPYLYWNFAVPIKLYEYIGRGKPIIASEGTLAGKFVKENDIGWTIPYCPLELEKLLNYLHENLEEIHKKAENAKKLAELNTWECRAQQVKRELLDLLKD